MPGQHSPLSTPSPPVGPAVLAEDHGHDGDGGRPANGRAKLDLRACRVAPAATVERRTRRPSPSPSPLLRPIRRRGGRTPRSATLTPPFHPLRSYTPPSAARSSARWASLTVVAPGVRTGSVPPVRAAVSSRPRSAATRARNSSKSVVSSIPLPTAQTPAAVRRGAGRPRIPSRKDCRRGNMALISPRVGARRRTRTLPQNTSGPSPTARSAWSTAPSTSLPGARSAADCRITAAAIPNEPAAGIRCVIAREKDPFYLRPALSAHAIYRHAAGTVRPAFDGQVEGMTQDRRVPVGTSVTGLA